MNKFKPSQIKKAIRGANQDQKATVAKAKKQIQNKVETMRYFSDALFSGYKIEQKTAYHFRINDQIDVWPARGKFHDIKTNERGVVEGSLLKFLNKKFTPISDKGKARANYVQVADGRKEPKVLHSSASSFPGLMVYNNSRQTRFINIHDAKTGELIEQRELKPNTTENFRLKKSNSLDYSPKFKDLMRKKERTEMMIYAFILVILILIAAHFGLLD